MVDPSTWKASNEYVWGYQHISATLKDAKTFLLTTVLFLLHPIIPIFSSSIVISDRIIKGNNTRTFEDQKGNAKQWVELIQYFATMHKEHADANK